MTDFKIIGWNNITDRCPKLYKEGMLFECGSGWYDLILDLSLHLEKLIEQSVDNEDMFACQVKEKYGTLRFYMLSMTEEMCILIQNFEEISKIVCEECGSLGKMRGRGWFYVQCDECYKKMRKENVLA